MISLTKSMTSSRSRKKKPRDPSKASMAFDIPEFAANSYLPQLLACLRAEGCRLVYSPASADWICTSTGLFGISWGCVDTSIVGLPEGGIFSDMPAIPFVVMSFGTSFTVRLVPLVLLLAVFPAARPFSSLVAPGCHVF
jgi:hypothetical protein